MDQRSATKSPGKCKFPLPSLHLPRAGCTLYSRRINRFLPAATLQLAARAGRPVDKRQRWEQELGSTSDFSDKGVVQ